MKVAYNGKQLTFEEMKGSLSCLPKDNQWVKLGDSLPWDGFDKLYLSKLRNEVEAAFGTSKRVYRANNIRAKLPGTAECWTGMCYLVKNLAKFLRGLCRVLTEMSPFRRILGIIRLAFGELAQGISCCRAILRQKC